MSEWISVKDRLPEKRDWYLAVFREIDTGFQLVPCVADYIGHPSAITTSDNWNIMNLDEPKEYIKKLKCVVWMPLPPAYEGE